MGLRNLTLVIAPNLLVGGDGSAARGGLQKKKTQTLPTFTAIVGKRGSREAPPTAAPLSPMEELMNIEVVSNALHTLAAASVRFSM